MSPEHWKRNLYTIFVAELIVLMGFSFVTPFLPLYIQKVGNLDTGAAAFWSGIASSAAGIAMFLSSPVWGIMADRWGRKPMVLRAMFGGGIIITITGMVSSVPAIIALRFLQGLLSGTVAAASALVASTTPRDKMPYAMGLLMVGVFAGNTVGPLVGGFIADTLGYNWAFYITGATLFSGGLIVTFFVKEQFTRPAAGSAASMKSMVKLAKSREILPLLIVTFALQAGPSIVSPILALYIKELGQGMGSAATVAGTAFFFMGLVATVSSLVAGRVGQRVNLKTILVFSSFGTAILYLPPMLAGNVTQLLIFVAAMALLKGGLITTSNTLVGLAAPPDQQGAAYGVNQSASSLGGALGPLLGGALAPLIGLKAVFGVTAGVYALVGLMVWKVLSGVDPTKTSAPQPAGASGTKP